jgi:hypothetical protein
MTLDTIYRDVVSRLKQRGLENDFSFLDITKAINDAIRQLRLEFIKNGQAQEFLYTEDVYVVEDSDYEQLSSGDLTYKPIQELPSELVFYNMKLLKTPNELTDTTSSFTEGDTAYRNGILYEAVKTSSAINTYDLIFDPKTVRNYKKSNGIKYKVGDVLYDPETEDYYKVNTEFTATSDTIASSLSELDVLYWKKRGDKWINPQVIPYRSLSNYTILGSFYNFISFLNTTLYTNSDISHIKVSYVPIWEDVNTLSTELELPDFMLNAIKTVAMQLLIGVETNEREK